MADVERMTSGPAQARAPKVRHYRRRLLLFLVAVVVAFFALLSALVWRLAQGPITTTIGTGLVREMLSERLGADRKVDIGVIGIALTENMQPELIVRDISVVRPNDVAFSINSVSIETGWSSLLGQALRIKSIRIDRLFVAILGPDMSLPPPEAILAGFRYLVADARLQYFEIATLDFRMQMPDRPARDVLTDVSITAEGRGQSGLKLQAIALGVEGTTSLGLDVRFPEKSEPYHLTFTSSGIDIADLAALSGREAPAVVGPVALSSEIDVRADGGLSGASGHLSLGPFRDADGGDGDMLLQDPIALELSWNADRRSVELRPSPIVLDKGHLLVFGEVRPPEAGAATWRYDMSVKAADITAAGDDYVGRLAGTFDSDTGEFAADDIRLDGRDVAVNAALRGDAGDRAYAVLSAAAPRLTLANLKALWPASLIRPVRAWIGEYLKRGMIENAKIDVAMDEIGGGAPPRMTVAFDFSGGAFIPYDGGPLIQDASGHGRLDGNRFEIVVDSGWADVGGKRLVLGRSIFTVPVVDAAIARGVTSLAVSGPAAGALTLWTSLPYAAASGFSLAPDKTGGAISATLSIEVPLVDDIRPEDVRIAGKLDVEDFSSAQPINGHMIRKGNMTIEVGDGPVKIRGTADIDGTGADIDLAMPLDGRGAATSTVRLVLDAAARKQMGLSLGGILSGPIGVQIASTDGGPDKGNDLVTIDLADAGIDLPVLGFHKAIGKPGKLTFHLAKSDEGIRIGDLVARIGSASAEGRLTIGADGRLEQLDLPKCDLSGGDRFAVSAERQDSGLKVTVSGARLDARSLIDSFLKHSGGGDGWQGDPMLVSATLDSMAGYGGEEIKGVNLSLKLADSGVRAMSLSLQSPGGAATSATLTPGDGSRRLRIEVGDVGNFMRFLDVYGRIYGGRAVVDGRVDDRGRLAASVDGANWKVVEEPALARLSTASPEGPTSGLSTADLRRLSYDIGFKNGQLSINEGYVRTDTAGLTMNGDVDFDKGVLRLAGSYLPASQLDRFLGRVPLLGWTIFAGGQAGLLGVSYRMTGPIGAPDVTVNPLSAVAPGIFRRLFEMK